MDREYILFKCRKRIEELREKYFTYCKERTVKKNTAALRRAQIKRDIQVLMLIEQLCLTSRAVFIEDEDAIDGFMKLVEPRNS